MKKTKRTTRGNATVENVRIYREFGVLPKALTLRFLALLTPKELRKLYRALRTAFENYQPGDEARYRRLWDRVSRVGSEMLQRGMK